MKKNGATRYPSWISRYSYHSAEQTVKNKKLDHRVHRIKKKQMIVEAGDEGLTAAELFYALAA